MVTIWRGQTLQKVVAREAGLGSTKFWAGCVKGLYHRTG